ncbi:MAG: M24 family metallopeptidase [Ilumatobacteraceae bacterium]
MSIAHRCDLVRTGLAEGEALLVTDLSNVRWLSGFSGSSGWVVVTHESMTLVTDGRYGTQARRQADAAGVDLDVRVGTSQAEMLALVDAAVAGARAVSFESTHMTVAQHASFVKSVSAPLVATAGRVEACRRRKDPSEIETIARAAAIADAALAEVAPLLSEPTPSLTEARVRDLLESRMRELGAAGPSYETIVASGPTHAALPHHRPTSQPIELGHTVVIDVGALLDGYHSDMTRTFVVGAPDAEQQRVYDAVLEAQLAGLALVRPGVQARDIDDACRSVLVGHGLGDWFTHGTGHGVGLLIHEDPFLNRVSEAVLAEGDVVTVEPGAYSEGFGGVRVEDLVVVTSDGCRVLTSSPKDSPCPPSPPTT